MNLSRIGLIAFAILLAAGLRILRTEGAECIAVLSQRAIENRDAKALLGLAWSGERDQLRLSESAIASFLNDRIKNEDVRKTYLLNITRGNHRDIRTYSVCTKTLDLPIDVIDVPGVGWRLALSESIWQWCKSKSDPDGLHFWDIAKQTGIRGMYSHRNSGKQKWDVRLP